MKAGAPSTPVRVAAAVRRTLTASARPAGEFDASRYFRGSGNLGFYNVGMTAVRRLAADIYTTHRNRARHRSLWVRRASAVGVIPLVRRGKALALAYRIARRLHPDQEDLIQKAVGWMLREAGKTDPARLEAYLRSPR